jgi:hypothetical protein
MSAVRIVTARNVKYALTTNVNLWNVKDAPNVTIMNVYSKSAVKTVIVPIVKPVSTTNVLKMNVAMTVTARVLVQSAPMVNANHSTAMRMSVSIVIHLQIHASAMNVV